MVACNKFYEKHRDENVNAKLADVDISFKKKDILENAEKIDDVYLKLMYLIMFLLPTRRIGELTNMRIAKIDSDVSNNITTIILSLKNYNWYWRGSFYNNNTKTKTSYINKDIDNEIIELINKLPDDTDFIFKYENINAVFSNLTNSIYNITLTANDVRHLYATYSVSSGNGKKIMNDAKLMNHSVEEHCLYCIEKL